jgi:hypothetical protein
VYTKLTAEDGKNFPHPARLVFAFIVILTKLCIT